MILMAAPATAKAASSPKMQNTLAHLEQARLNRDVKTMKTIRVLTTMLIFLIITFSSINCSSDRAQAVTAEALKASEADLQRGKKEYISLMEEKIAAFRRSLDEMKVLAGNVSSPTRIARRHSMQGNTMMWLGILGGVVVFLFLVGIRIVGNSQLLKRLETAQYALQNNAKIIVPAGKQLVNVIGDLAGIIPQNGKADSGMHEQL
jgi:hypothetical protein